mmetsp:Transcript_21328/g.30883  ORF Transcript_21328/g.30883 Transcript_21328/m.30883 type:complete len:270 (+) Transcript_21328:297-1106(+)
MRTAMTPRNRTKKKQSPRGWCTTSVPWVVGARPSDPLAGSNCVSSPTRRKRTMMTTPLHPEKSRGPDLDPVRSPPGKMALDPSQKAPGQGRGLARIRNQRRKTTKRTSARAPPCKLLCTTGPRVVRVSCACRSSRRSRSLPTRIPILATEGLPPRLPRRRLWLLPLGFGGESSFVRRLLRRRSLRTWRNLLLPRRSMRNRKNRMSLSLHHHLNSNSSSNKWKRTLHLILAHRRKSWNWTWTHMTPPSWSKAKKTSAISIPYQSLSARPS